MGARFHQPMRLDHLIEREDRVDRGRAASGVQHRPDFLPQLGRDLAFLRRRARAHGGAGDGQAAHHDLHHIEILDLRSAEERDQHETPVHAEAANVAHRIGAADHVQNDIDAAPAGQFLDAGGEILGPVIDRGVAAEAEAGGGFVVRSGGRVNGRAKFFRQLDRGHADAAGATVDQRLFAAFQPARLEQIGPDGEEGFRQRRGAQRVVALGPGQALRGGRGAILGIGPAIGQRADLIAHRPTGDGGADGRDLPRAFQAQDGRGAGGRRIGTLPLRDIRAVHAGGLDPDQDFVRLRFRARSGGDPHHLRRARAVHLNIPHAGHDPLLSCPGAGVVEWLGAKVTWCPAGGVR